MNEPIRFAFSREEIVRASIDWMNANYSDTKKESPDRFYERLGLIVDFVTDVFSSKEGGAE